MAFNSNTFIISKITVLPQSDRMIDHGRGWCLPQSIFRIWVAMPLFEKPSQLQKQNIIRVYDYLKIHDL